MRGALIAGLVLLGAADLLVLNLVAVPRYIEGGDENVSSPDPGETPPVGEPGRAPEPSPTTPPPSVPEPVVAMAEPIPEPPIEQPIPVEPEPIVENVNEPAPEPPVEEIDAVEPEPAIPEPDPPPVEPEPTPEEAEPPPLEPESTEPPLPSAPVPRTGPPRGAADLRFGSNSATLGPRARENLTHVAEEMSRNPSLRVLLRGHTDERGSDSLNLGLSRRRADNAAAFLIERGVSPERLLVEGVGAAQPVDRTGNDSAMARNRRVQVIWR